ncbi:MAG: endo-beta-N-acetylglucosaminidase [Catenulispora sp.]|nr:endo-beta-N-acetylglucosaminidase [Catenulispora sp.]
MGIDNAQPSRRTLLRGAGAAGTAIGLSGLLQLDAGDAAAAIAPKTKNASSPPGSTTDPAGLTVTPHEPWMHGYLAKDLASWSPSSDPYAKYFRSRVPLAPRIPVFAATQANPALSYGPQVLDLSDDYMGKMAYRSLRQQNDATLRTSRFWQYTDIYASWHGLITATSTLDSNATYGVVNIPNPAWTDAAHRNGVKSLGCWFWPRGDTFSQLVTKNADGTFPVADQLLAMAAYFGFDGYFINQEATVSATDAANLMAMFKYLRAKAPAGFHVQYYDAMLPSGTLSYQNTFDSANAPWVRNGTTPVCNSLFVNYAWNGTAASNSRSYAQSLGLDPYATVYLGTECQGRGFVQYGYDPRGNFPEGGTAQNSWGIFGGTTNILCPPGVDLTVPANQADRYAKERYFWSGPNGDPTRTGRVRPPSNSDTSTPYDTYQVWDGVAHYIVERSAIGAFPFVTRFNTGKGFGVWRKGTKTSAAQWANAGAADILPTWQWWVTATGSSAPLAVDYDLTTAWDGGASLKVAGPQNPGDTSVVRLFKTHLTTSTATTARIRYNANSAGTNLGLSIGVVFADAPSQTTWLPVGATYSTGWNTETVSLSPYSGRTIAAISLRFAAASATTYAVNIGELAFLDGSAQTPSAPTAFAIDASYVNGTAAEMLLSWTLASSGVWYYDIRRLRPDGSVEALGRTYDDVFYVAEIDQISGESTTTVQLVPVSPTGDEGPAATATLTWTGGGGGTPVNLALNRPATGTTPANSNETPPKAVNGSVSGGLSDKFCSLVSPSWLQVDLGAAHPVTGFEVDHAAAGGESASYNTRDFSIAVSTDNASWQTVVTVTGNTAAVTTHPVGGVTARYVRLTVTKPTQTSDHATRIYELRVLGT